jgi:tRNA1(Val) A37 N6-methylase TrmN6
MKQDSYQEARKKFPAGLEQPEGSFRFSKDALLLASFTSERDNHGQSLLAELGTGCGVVALSVLLQHPLWQAYGMELVPELVSAANRNASLLGVQDRFTVIQGDVSHRADWLRLRQMSWIQHRGLDDNQLPLYDIVCCNPPWRDAEAGRIPDSPLRRMALFGNAKTFHYFFTAADAILKSGGYLTAVGGAERTADMLAALPERMKPELLRFVFTKSEAPATFVLLLAHKNGKGTLKIEKREDME